MFHQRPQYTILPNGDILLKLRYSKSDIDPLLEDELKTGDRIKNESGHLDGIRILKQLFYTEWYNTEYTKESDETPDDFS